MSNINEKLNEKQQEEFFEWLVNKKLKLGIDHEFTVKPAHDGLAVAITPEDDHVGLYDRTYVDIDSHGLKLINFIAGHDKEGDTTPVLMLNNETGAITRTTYGRAGMHDPCQDIGIADDVELAFVNGQTISLYNLCVDYSLKSLDDAIRSEAFNNIAVNNGHEDGEFFSLREGEFANDVLHQYTHIVETVIVSDIYAGSLDNDINEFLSEAK